MVKITPILAIYKGAKMRGNKKAHEKFIDRDQFASLVKAAKANAYSRASELIYSAGVLGLRLGEAITLNRGCFDLLARGFVEIETLKRFDVDHPVNGKRLGVYPHLVLPVAIGPNIRKFFEKLLDKTPKGTKYLFPGRGKGSHISTTHAQRVFHESAIAAGLGPRYSFHCLRHHKGVALWEKTKDREQIAAQLRHSSVDSTKIYTGLSDKDKLELAAQTDADYNFAP